MRAAKIALIGWVVLPSLLAWAPGSAHAQDRSDEEWRWTRFPGGSGAPQRPGTGACWSWCPTPCTAFIRTDPVPGSRTVVELARAIRSLMEPGEVAAAPQRNLSG